MNGTRDELALRKELLLARSALCRLRLRHQAGMLRESLTLRAAGTAIAASPRARDVVFLLAAEGLGRRRVDHWLVLAARALAVARMAGLAFDLLRRPGAAPR